jgi:hypothetical protein
VTRARKAKKYPAKYPNRRVLIAAIRLLKQVDPKSDVDRRVRDGLIGVFNKIGHGADARVMVGQAPGRGGNRKSKTLPFKIGLAYWPAHDSGMTIANACRAVRTQLGIRNADATIVKIAREQRDAVRAHLEYKHDFDGPSDA